MKAASEPAAHGRPRFRPTPGRRRRRAARALGVVVGLVVGLCLAEVLVRAAAHGLHRAPLVESDPHLGWRNRGGLHRVRRDSSGASFVVSRDADGLRATGAPQGGASGRDGIVLLLGDSFVFGVGVDDEETLGWQLGELTSREVVSLGVSGYGTDQELGCLVSWLDAHPAARVECVVAVVFENDLIDVQRAFDPYLGHSKPRWREELGRLVPTPYERSLADRAMDLSRLWWLVRSKLGALCAHESLAAENGVWLAVAALDEARAASTRRGATFATLAHRRLRGTSIASDATWATLLTATGARDLTEGLTARGATQVLCPDGVHWSGNGNRHVATVIAAACGGQPQ